MGPLLPQQRLQPFELVRQQVLIHCRVAQQLPQQIHTSLLHLHVAAATLRIDSRLPAQQIVVDRGHHQADGTNRLETLRLHLGNGAGERIDGGHQSPLTREFDRR